MTILLTMWLLTQPFQITEIYFLLVRQYQFVPHVLISLYTVLHIIYIITYNHVGGDPCSLIEGLLTFPICLRDILL